MQLKPGSVWYSATSEAQVVVVRPAAGGVELTCGGRPMLDAPPATVEEPLTADPGQLLIGKRYVDGTSGLELLCSKGGTGTLACDGRPLEMAQPKPLPSSD